MPAWPLASNPPAIHASHQASCRSIVGGRSSSTAKGGTLFMWADTIAVPRPGRAGIDDSTNACLRSPPPKGGVGIKQIARMERNTVIAAPGRKPEFTSAARLFSYQRLHEISSGQIREKSSKKFLLIRHRIRSQDRAQYGTVSYDRRTRSTDRTPEYFRRKRRRAFADLAWGPQRGEGLLTRRLRCLPLPIPRLRNADASRRHRSAC